MPSIKGKQPMVYIEAADKYPITTVKRLKNSITEMEEHNAITRQKIAHAYDHVMASI